MIGAMAMPANFQYKDVFLKGYPEHLRFDPFRLKHPSMENSRRAKIFSPFDALKGFNEAVAAKEVLYEFKRELSDGEKEELDRRLGILHRLTFNGRLARENKVVASVTYYVPCGDKNHDAYGYRGQYVTVKGIVWKLGLKTITVGETTINFRDIVDIQTEYTVTGRNIFDEYADYMDDGFSDTGFSDAGSDVEADADVDAGYDCWEVDAI